MTHDLLHGGALDRMRDAFPNAPEPWIDLSTGINPWAYPVGTIPEAPLRHLPTQGAYEACRQAMARSMMAPPESLVLAPGSELLIRLLPTIIRPKKVAILSPTYGDHLAVWNRADTDIVETAEPLAMAGEVDAIVICNPNNPDGRSFEPGILLQTAASLAGRGGWLIVDEAYAELDPGSSLASSGGADGLIVLRSFGKFFGLAGLRLGALLAPEPVRISMQKLLGVWPVSGPALHIGAKACSDLEWQDRTRFQLTEAKVHLDSTLRSHGVKIVGGTALFRLVETDNASAFWEKLAQAGIYVRRFAWNDRLIRIGLPENRAAEDRLAAALSP